MFVSICNQLLIIVNYEDIHSISKTIHHEAANIGSWRGSQREIIHNHVKNKPILAEYIETESGKKSNRPQLLAALAMCRKSNSI